MLSNLKVKQKLQMKRTLIALLFALCVIQTACQTCTEEGYTTISPVYKENVVCKQCQAWQATCDSSNATFIDSINSQAYGKTSLGYDTSICANSNKYNVETEKCQNYCDQGCYSCELVTSFCTECHEGYLWISDYSCIPVLVPLQITSLVIMLASIVVVVVFIFKHRK